MSESRLQELRDAAFAISPLVVEKAFSHMKEPWEMILGGLIFPAMIKEDPESIKENPKFVALMEKYSKEAVTEFFTPKVEEKVIETVVERVKVISGAGGAVKFRRVKEKVSKDKKMERTLRASDRDIIIKWWNTNQRLMDRTSGECQALVDAIHATDTSVEPLAPAQVAGHVSRLSDMGMKHDREERALRWITKGMCTVRPEWTKEFLDAIERNYEAERKDEAERAKDHALIREGKTYEPKPKTATPSAAALVTEPTTGSIEEPTKVTVGSTKEIDDFDILDIA